MNSICLSCKKCWTLYGLGKSKRISRGYKKGNSIKSFYKKHGYIIDKEEYIGKPYDAYGVRLTKNIECTEFLNVQ